MVGGWREVEARKNWRSKWRGRPKRGGRLEKSRGQKKLEAKMSGSQKRAGRPKKRVRG